MNYDIKIVGEDEDNGRIEFDRLAMLTQSTKDIATKALMLQLRGYSDITPDKHLKKTLHMFLENIVGDANEGTSLTIDCKHFSETIKGVQLDAFQPKEEVLELTPMALVIRSFHAALDEDNPNMDIDKPLLRSLLNFKKNFISDNEIFYLANRGSIAEVKLTRDDFKKIKVLEESIPEPQNVVLYGKLDEMKISKGRVGLLTEDDKLINLVSKKDSDISGLLDFMGNEITVKGKAHYKPNGDVSFVEIQDFNTPQETDKYFSSIPKAKNVQQQLFSVAKIKTKNNSFEALKGLSGLLKDEISEEQFQEMLKDTHL